MKKTLCIGAVVLASLSSCKILEKKAFGGKDGGGMAQYDTISQPQSYVPMNLPTDYVVQTPKQTDTFLTSNYQK